MQRTKTAVGDPASDSGLVTLRRSRHTLSQSREVQVLRLIAVPFSGLVGYVTAHSVPTVPCTHLSAVLLVRPVLNAGAGRADECDKDCCSSAPDRASAGHPALLDGTVSCGNSRDEKDLG